MSDIFGVSILHLWWREGEWQCSAATLVLWSFSLFLLVESVLYLFKKKLLVSCYCEEGGGGLSILEVVYFRGGECCPFLPYFVCILDFSVI